MNRRLSELWILLKAEKRKSVTLASLLLVALGMWARAAITGSGAGDSAPASANAADRRPDDDAQDRKKEKSRPARPEVNLPQTARLDRDLFALRGEALSPPSQPEPQDDSAHKSSAEKDDNSEESKRLRRETLVQRVRDQAAKLRLRSTMLSANPIAVIEQDGSGEKSRVLRIGESVAGFELIEVRAQSAVLKKSGVRVVLSRERKP